MPGAEIRLAAGWVLAALDLVHGSVVSGDMTREFAGVSIDTRTLAAGDKLIVEGQQRQIDENPGHAHFTNFAFDRSGQSARHILRRLMNEEQAQGEALAAAE